MGKVVPRQRAPRYSGGLTHLSAQRIDRDTGERVEYSYWQASREVPREFLPAGVERKRITGNGPTQAIAKQRLERNFNRYISPKAQDERKGGGRKRRAVQQLFDE
jgi:hypothetical protein